MNKDQFKKLMKSAPKPVIHIRVPYEIGEEQAKEANDRFEEKGYLLLLESDTNLKNFEIVGIYSVWDKMFSKPDASIEELKNVQLESIESIVFGS